MVDWTGGGQPVMSAEMLRQFSVRSQERARAQYTSADTPLGPYVVHAGRGDEDPGDQEVEPPKRSNKEHLQRAAGIAVGLSSVVAEHVFSHPCIVLRRQCQVYHNSAFYHLTPFTLFQPLFNIQMNQSITTMWKGIGSTLMVKGITIASETTISEVTPLPREVTRHSSVKKVAEHLFLKGLSYIIITPFYAASLLETVQSEIASEQPGVLDCLREACSRVLSLNAPQTTRLLPVWKLVPPTLLHGMLHYIISSLAQYTVQVSTRAEMAEKQQGSSSIAEEPEEKSLYETFYPELIATFTGNLLADTLLYPLETVLHRLGLQGTRTIIDNTDTGLGVLPVITQYEGVRDCVRTIVNEEGVGGFYKGFGALIMQYALHMALLRLTRAIFDTIAREMSPVHRAKQNPIRRSFSLESSSLRQTNTQSSL